MSKITNLIGTTWRLDGLQMATVPEGYGIFAVNMVGTVTLIVNDEGNGQDINVTTIGCGYSDSETPESGVCYVIVLEDVQGIGHQLPIAGESYYNWVYELTITGGTDISNPLFIDFINTYGTLVSGGEPPTAEGVKTKLQSLLTASNAKTGKSDANLTDAVKTLLEGYGSGDGIFAEEENEHGTTVVLGADLQEKTVDITANGPVEVTPDEGYALKKVTAKVDVKGNDKIQRYIELNKGTAYNLFCGFQGTSIGDLLDGVDMGNVTNAYGMFNDCIYLTTVPLFDTSSVTTMMYMFNNCKHLIAVPSFDARAATFSNTFGTCKALTEIWIRNIKANLQIGSGTGSGTFDYGHLLTLESLLHLCKECRKTTSSLKLTVGTANLAKLEGIYVKLIDITDEMRAEDDLIDEKYPFVQCESTDDGAMTIQDYMATKKWSLA